MSRIDHSGSGLPPAVQTAIAALRGNTIGAVAVPIPGRTVRVEASPAGADGSVAVVMSAVQPPAMPAAPAA